MNTRKTSISHVINDDPVPITSEQHHHQQQESTPGVCSLKNILSDDSPVHTQQHASPTQHSQQSPPSQQYNHGAGNSGSGGNNNVGYSGPYSNEHNYYQPRSHQQPPSSQPPNSHNQIPQQQQQQEQNNQSYQMDDSYEASSILLLLSNQNSSNQSSTNSNYTPSRDPYHPKDNEQQMPDMMDASNITNNVKSNSQQINRQESKNNTMSITSICCDGESGPSESGHSIQNGSSMETSLPKYQQQSYPEDTHPHQIVDYNSPYNNRKHVKKPSIAPIPLVVNTSQKIPQKEPKVIQKRASPQKRRPSEPSEFTLKPKIHHRNPDSHFSHGTLGGPKLTELREQLGEDRNANRLTPIVPIQAGMEWDRSQHSQHSQSQHTHHTQQHLQHSQPYHQTRPSHNIPPQAEMIRYNHPPQMPKNGSSPSLHNDPQKFNYMNSNERQSNKTTSTGPPVHHVPNGYPHSHGVGPVGGVIGTHPDMMPQPSHQQPPHPQPPQMQPIPIAQQQMPPLRGHSSAFVNQIHKKYNDMKHDPKMKRNAPHAYISYMIYTNQMQENSKGKDSQLQSQPPQNNMPSRQMQNGSHHDHGMVNPQIMPVNESMYGHRDHRESQHTGYPPIQPATTPAYMHPSEAVTNPGRRVSDPSIHSGSRVPHGYPVNGPPVEEHQPLPSHRQSISSHNSSPGLLPAHSTTLHRQILPNIVPNSNQHPTQRHVQNNPSPTTTTTSRADSISHQPQITTVLPPIQSAPPHHHHHNHPSSSQPHHHHYHPQEHINNQNHGHSHSHYHQPVSQASQPQPPPVYMPAPLNSYNGKSSPAQPQPQSQSPINSLRQQSNHYHHTSTTVPLSQGGSNRHHHHHHHHHQSISEPVVPPVNGNNSQSILSSPSLSRLLDSQSQSSGYGHPHHHQHLTNGVGMNHPVNIAPAQAQALGPPVQRGAPNVYY